MLRAGDEDKSNDTEADNADTVGLCHDSLVPTDMKLNCPCDVFSSFFSSLAANV